MGTEIDRQILMILSQYSVMTQSFGSMMGPSSDDSGLLVRFGWNRFLCMQCPKNRCFLFKYGAESFSCKQSFHIFSSGADGFTFLKISHLMLNLMFLFFHR